MTVLGVLADTHIPDRLAELPQTLMDAFRESQVDAILHAGDLCRPDVLTQLEQVAPVMAVRGNRDIFWPSNWLLPRSSVWQFDGIKIGLTHGSVDLASYLRRKLMAQQTSQSASLMSRQFSHDVRAIVYGHTHVPSIDWIDGTLLFNPGTVAPDWYTQDGPTAGLLEIESGRVHPTILRLEQFS